MSSMHNRIVTTFQANAGNAIGVMNQMAGGMTNIGRAAMGTQRQTGLVDQQMRAFGTTMRYAFAGSVLFGATKMLATLKETQRQMGLIAVLGDFKQTERGLTSMGTSLEALQKTAAVGSIEALTPVSELNDGLINLFSTVQNLDPKEAVKMTSAIAKGSRIAQVSVEEMIKTVAGMTTAFGRPQTLEEFNKFQAMFFTLTKEAPGGVQFGPQYVQALPQLASTAKLANISPETMFGTYLTGLRTAGTPATVGRGQQYMWQSLAVGASDEAKKALKSAGITPDTVQEKGGAWALGRLISHTKGLGVSGVAAADKIKFNDAQLSELEAIPPDAIGGTLGIKGKGAEFLSTAMGRIHAVRQVIAIMSQEGGDKAAKDIQTMTENASTNAKAMKIVGDQFDTFAKQNPLLATSIALDTTRRAIMNAAEPFINPIARKITEVGKRYAEEAEQHPDRTRHRTQIAGGIAGAVGLAMLLRRGRGGFLSRAFSGAGGAFVRGQAIADMAGGDMTRGHTPMMPLYVTVVGEIFPSGASPGLVGPGGFPTPTTISKQGKMTSWLKDLGKVALGAGATGGAWVAARGSMLAGQLTGHYGKSIATRAGLRAFPGVGAIVEALINPDVIATENPLVMRARDMERMGAIPQFQNIAGAKKRTIEGRAVMTLNLNVVQPDGTTKRVRRHIPVPLWEKGNVPSNRGKPGG